MEIFIKLFIDLYHLVVRAVALALSDAEFAADWGKFEADLAALGIDLPGEVAAAPANPSGSPTPTPSAQAVARPTVVAETLVRNPDGTVSLKEG